MTFLYIIQLATLTMKYQKIVLILSCLLLTSCIVSRLRRPMITGVVTDFDGNPIENCTVGETTTDQNGNYSLPELRYIEFFFGIEAPPLMVSEQITKEGYHNKHIQSFSSFGGSARKGAKWELDTIRLKKEHQKLPEITNTKWNINSSKNNDTIYFVKSNFIEICKSLDCNDFYYQNNLYSENYLNSSGRNNLPKEIIRRSIAINFKPEATFKGQKIIQYRDTGGNLTEQKPNDTTHLIGKWNFDNNKYIIKSELEEFQGTFELSEFDYEYMQWVKTTSL